MRLYIIGLICILIPVLLAGSPAEASEQPYENEVGLIEVMFSPESEVRLRDGIPVDLKSKALSGVSEILGAVSWQQWGRICPLSEERLDEIHARAERNSGKELYNPNNSYRLQVPDDIDIWTLSQELENLPGILLARPVPKPMAAPLPDDYEADQGYLDPASDNPSGVDAEYAWTLTGGDGTGVTVCDLEYAWNYNHGDLTKAVNSQINTNPLSIPSGETDDHGTAVIGVLVSDDNGWGTTGICHGANLKTCGTYYGVSPAWNVAGAIYMAIDSLDAGDVIVLEQQWDYSGSEAFIPIEWWLSTNPASQTYNVVYIAIETAVAAGIHVIEAGGNGGVNTESLGWYGNSGAIIVGAGGASMGPNADRQRLSFSSYGSRFDLQGWGENVVTAGYSDLYDDEGKNYYYTGTFDGTSSASPVVAGAVACCVGYWKGLGWDASLLTPELMRTILKQTGTSQDYSVPGNIGPRPNIRAACSLLILQEVEWGDATDDPLVAIGFSQGVAWGDYDDDGLMDIYLSRNGENKLLRNTGGGIFSDATTSPLNDAGVSKGVAWADYDNDGDVDLYMANGGTANQLFRNDDPGFTAVGQMTDAGYGKGFAWGEYDNDGHVDLYLTNWDETNRLYRNQGDGSFSDVTSAPLNDAGSSSMAVWGDYDNDGYPDLYLVNSNFQANKLFHNEGDGSFSDATAGALGNADYSTSAAWGDYDNDGYLDLYLVNNGQANKLFHNQGNGTFTDVTTGELVSSGYDFSAEWVDYDCDGDLDLYITASYCCNRLLRNDGGGTFVDATTGPLGDYQTYSLSQAWADYDNDGDQDLLVANSGSWDDGKLFENKLGSNNSWLKIDLEGIVSNRSAIGARVRVVIAGQSQIREIRSGSNYCSQNSLIAHFGLGSVTTVDSIIINWPSGIYQDTINVAANQTLAITEEADFECGDANTDGSVNVGDIVFIVNHVFHEGPEPNPYDVGDVNCDGNVNVGDAVYLVNYVFKEGSPVPCAECPE
jgi:hypothetical protein